MNQTISRCHMNNKTEHIAFEPETRTKIGAVTYIVTAHFDDTRENLPEKIQRLLRSELETKIAQLQNPSR